MFLKEYFGTIYKSIKSLLVGMKVTGYYFTHLDEIKTEEYPDNRATLKMFDRFRGEVVMPHDENNEHRCTGCQACEIACPNGTIKIITKQEILEDGKKKKRIDAFVYHLTCRGHRWNEKIGVNDDYFKIAEEKARKYYIKKWGSWIENDLYGHPILTPVYKKCSIVSNYIPFNGEEFLGDINPKNIDDYDIIINLDLKQINQNDFKVITQLN